MKKILINGKEVEFYSMPISISSLEPENQSKYLIIPEERIDNLISFLHDFRKNEGSKGFLAIKGIEKDFDISDTEPVIADMGFNGKDFTMYSFRLKTN
jgi:hypothetical protein